VYIAKLIEKGWLYRKFEVLAPHGSFEVAYDGKGIGYEQVTVNGEIANRRQSLFWYVPEFDFLIGGAPARISVRIWAWTQFRSFVFEINGETVYSE
jgi:hypothetical protein